MWLPSPQRHTALPPQVGHCPTTGGLGAQVLMYVLFVNGEEQSAQFATERFLPR